MFHINPPNPGHSLPSFDILCGNFVDQDIGRTLIPPTIWRTADVQIPCLRKHSFLCSVLYRSRRNSNGDYRHLRKRCRSEPGNMH